VNRLRAQLGQHPALIRVAPFALFLVLTSCQGKFFAHSEYWLYLGKTLLGVALIWLMRPAVTEMRWAFSWEAVATGVGVFLLWVGLDPLYPKLFKAETAWNPPAVFGEGSGLAWTFIAVRLLGSTFIVPPLEETFYRSFLYRNVASANWQSVPLNQFRWLPLLVTAGIFGFVHTQWLAGLLCGLAYQTLVLRRSRLGDAMTAHAITNFLLGLWVVFKPAWQFW
jgi:CAAX prenyl protease-like protein